MGRTIGTTVLAIFLLVATAAADDWDDWGDWNDREANGSREATDSDREAENGWGAEWKAGAGPLALSGYLETTAISVFPRNVMREDTEAGLQTLLRLRGRFEPEPFLSVTVETEFVDRGGAAAPGSVEPREIPFDYLYGAVAFGPVDLRVGRQPLAWGSAYAFNPTDLMNPSTTAGLAGVEPPGMTAISSAVTIGERLGLEAYLGFEDRSRNASALQELSRNHRLPWGVRGRAYLAMWDFGVGIARSAEWVPDSAGGGALQTEDYVVAEAVGSIGPVLLYAEAAIEVGADDRHPERSLDGVVGAVWDPLDRLSLQAEYHRRGRGATDPDDYRPADRLARRLVGRDYLVGVGTLSMMSDDLELTLASLLNLNDRSSALIPELTCRITDDFHTTVGGSLFLGSRESEFDGRFSDDSLGEVDLGLPRLFLRATWYF